MNDKIEQRARELLAVAERGPIAEYGVVHRRTAHQAITAALREQAAPKPEAQAALRELREEIASFVKGGHARHDLLRWVNSLDSILPPPASHDAQQPDREFLGRVVRMEWMAWAQEQPVKKPSWLVPWDEMSEADREVDRRIGERIWNISNPLFAQQPAVVGDGARALVAKWRDAAADSKRFGTTDYEYGRAAELTACASELEAALTPAATADYEGHLCGGRGYIPGPEGTGTEYDAQCPDCAATPGDGGAQ